MAGNLARGTRETDLKKYMYMKTSQKLRKKKRLRKVTALTSMKFWFLSTFSVWHLNDLLFFSKACEGFFFASSSAFISLFSFFFLERDLGQPRPR